MHGTTTSAEDRPPVAVGRRRGSLVPLGSLAVLAATFLFMIAFLLEPPPDPSAVVVGDTEDFPPGTVAERVIETTFTDPAAHDPQTGEEVGAERNHAPVWIVHHPRQGLLALYARDPHLGCRVEHVAGPADVPSGILRTAPAGLRDEVGFFNPCHGELYTLSGEAIPGGPQPRGLDRFGITVTDDGRVVLDLTDFERGPARTASPGA